MMRRLSFLLLALIAGNAMAKALPRPVHFPVSTKSAAAQSAMDEGMKWVYGFNHDEAIASFRSAAAADPKLAMAHWGIALALGPNINLDVDPEREKAAFDEAQKALALVASSTPREQAYIRALARRYSDKPDADLKKLAADYSNAMHEVMKRYPSDLDAATLWAESAMDLRPWKLWSADGKPAEGTPEILAALESVLARDPKHLGANHYYIHAIEASPHPEKAMASARRIAALAPDAGHLVHMPAHILMRTGDYDGAAVANERAADVDRAYIARHGANGVYPMMYYNHNLDFLAAARAMEGRYAEAKKAADMLRDNVAPMVADMPMVEPFLTRPIGILIRFAKWDEIMAMKEPPSSHLTELAYYRLARGVAFAARGDAASARVEAEELHAVRAAMPVDAMFGLNETGNVLEVAERMLEARIARVATDHAAEIAAWRKAAAAEDALAYDEPPAFFYPVRESLGGALLRGGQNEEAAAVFRADLKMNPGNVRSLLGLSTAIERMGEKDRAAMLLRRYREAGGDPNLTVDML